MSELSLLNYAFGEPQDICISLYLPLSLSVHMYMCVCVCIVTMNQSFEIRQFRVIVAENADHSGRAV
jgi:hypothetical protein